MEKGQIDFAKDSVWNMIFRLAPPVMAAQLIQALYNIVDSFFIGRCSEEGLTALSIVYPLQLLMIALAVGSGVGINTAMAFFSGIKKEKRAAETAGVGTPLAFVLWLLFALICYLIMPFYAKISTESEMIRADVVRYGRIVCVFSFGLFFESIWTKILQSKGNMKLPMTAQIIGAAVNIVLDPLLIFGWLGLPKLGITGAAISTVIGQIAAALIVMKRGFYKPPALKKYWVNIRNIFRLGTPNILMQSAYTFYIFGLNMILATFSDQAVTVLGLYYKWQTFFFIPLGALQTCIVPMISFNYAQQNTKRCRSILWDSFIAGAVLMGMGTLCFLFIPSQMIRFFLPRQRSPENRRSRLPHNRAQLCTYGGIPAVSRVLSGSGKSLQKLSSHRDSYRVPVRPSRLAVRQIRAVLLLADIPHNGDNNLCRGICHVQQIRQC